MHEIGNVAAQEPKARIFAQLHDISRVAGEEVVQANHVDMSTEQCLA
jgi:hypothetical protein